jgi:magnesium-dependent phosphatase 1
MDNSPDLIVFDLDYTLWPFWVDTHVYPPFCRASSGKILDARKHEVKCYPEVPQILSELHSCGVQMAVASRTACDTEAIDLLRLFEWDKYFAYREIYPGDKTSHFKKFHKNSSIPLSRMLFFDDEDRNIYDVSRLGVTCVLVEDGMTKEVLEKGLSLFAGRHSTDSS